MEPNWKNPPKHRWLHVNSHASSEVSSKNWRTRCQICGTANCPIVWGQSWRSMESMVRAVTWRSLPYRLWKYEIKVLPFLNCFFLLRKTNPYGNSDLGLIAHLYFFWMAEGYRIMNSLLCLFIGKWVVSEKVQDHPMYSKRLKNTAEDKNCQLCLFMICMMKNGFFWEPLLKMLDLLKRNARILRQFSGM